MVINIYYKENELLDNGKLDEQIINDLETYLENRRKYQEERLDLIVKRDSPHHYEEWTKENQLKIKYTERILECVKCVKEQSKHKYLQDLAKREIIDVLSGFCGFKEWERLWKISTLQSAM